MNSKSLALITGFGGINSAGRSSSHLSYKNLIYNSLNEKEQLEVLQDLAVLQGKIEPLGRAWETISGDNIDLKNYLLENETLIRKDTMVRKLDSDTYDKDGVILDQIKASHKDFFAKYDVKHMAPFNFLQGVNPETGEADGSVRFYYDMQVTNSSKGKSVVIPIYESFDFDDEGKAIFAQWYCDWTASLSSLE